jgi:hypothetical protein
MESNAGSKRVVRCGLVVESCGLPAFGVLSPYFRRFSQPSNSHPVISRLPWLGINTYCHPRFLVLSRPRNGIGHIPFLFGEEYGLQTIVAGGPEWSSTDHPPPPVEKIGFHRWTLLKEYGRLEIPLAPHVPNETLRLTSSSFCCVVPVLERVTTPMTTTIDLYHVPWAPWSSLL